MYIKILVYIIDNQQVKYKISIIFFRLADRLPFLFPVLRGWGGAGPKNGSPAGPISGRWSVPHPISNKRQPSPNTVPAKREGGCPILVGLVPSPSLRPFRWFPPIIFLRLILSTQPISYPHFQRLIYFIIFAI